MQFIKRQTFQSNMEISLVMSLATISMEMSYCSDTKQIIMLDTLKMVLEKLKFYLEPDNNCHQR
jgi:hypothetical protein